MGGVILVPFLTFVLNIDIHIAIATSVFTFFFSGMVGYYQYYKHNFQIVEDTNGDGIINSEDEDVDGDGIPNDIDNDIDGDGITNENDDTISGFLFIEECNKFIFSFFPIYFFLFFHPLTCITPTSLIKCNSWAG